MKSIFTALLVVICFSTCGCSFYDAMFNVLGDNYTGGGTTKQEKKWHYDGVKDDWGVQ